MENTSSLNSTEQIISAVAQLSLSELERVFDRVLALQAERKAGRLPPVESELLVRINQGWPPELRKRLAFLKTKREDESIADAEYEELTRLTDQAEELHAKRMAAMVELARLRGVSLPELMNQLGIHFPENV
jgi:hypothetical protein